MHNVVSVEIQSYFQIQNNSSQKGLNMSIASKNRWLGLSREDQIKLFERTMIFGYGPRVCLGKEYVLMTSSN